MTHREACQAGRCPRLPSPPRATQRPGRSPRATIREVARTTENPATKLLAEGLTALAEALRELDDELRNVRKQVAQ
jgi:hypothetical protein